MQHFARRLSLGMCYISAVSSVSVMPGQLRHGTSKGTDAHNATAPASVDPVAAPQAAAWRGDLEHVLLHFFEEATEARAQVTEDNATRTKGNKKTAEESKSAQPVHMQMTEKELKAWMVQLSSGCKQQFASIIQGRSPGFHSYGASNTAVSQEYCTQLGGSLCALAARVSMEKKDASGETMSSMTSVHGNGCVPGECMASKDLKVLAHLMQSKAKEAMSGTGADIKLHVDCSIKGGSIAEIGTGADNGDSAGPKVGQATRGATRGQVKKEGAAAIHGLATFVGLGVAAAFMRF